MMIFRPRKETECVWQQVMNWYMNSVGPTIQLEVLEKQAPMPIVRSFKADLSRNRGGDSDRR